MENLFRNDIKGTLSGSQHCSSNKDSLGNLMRKQLHCIRYTCPAKIMSNQDHLYKNQKKESTNIKGVFCKELILRSRFCNTKYSILACNNAKWPNYKSSGSPQECTVQIFNKVI